MGDLAGRLRSGAGYASRRLPHFKGKVRLCTLLDQWLKSSEPGVLASDVDGIRFLLDTADLNDFRLLYGLDSGVVDYLLGTLADARNVVVWDVGANVGAISLVLAARCPGVRVVAIEASPSVGRRLAGNVAANPELAGRIDVLHVALGRETGTTQFFESAESFNSGVGRMQAAGNTLAAPVSVPMWRGDDVIEQGLAPAPDLIKIDIEGFEEPALRGLFRHLSHRRPQLVMEHEPYRLATPGNPPSPIAYLRELGYTIRELQGHRLGPPIEIPPSSHTDLVALCDRTHPH